jgi:glycosyltransferase involved in cell wall biosynthesis
MDNKPFFSIIIPVYNREKFIEKAVESIYAQEFSNWELILINDASTDNTATILNAMKSEKVVVVHNEKNKERCVSRNIGVQMSKGNYVCFLDSDDYHLPNHLSTLHNAIKERNYPEAFFFTNAWNEDMTGRRGERICPDYGKYNPYAYFLQYTVNPQRWCVSKSILTKHSFDPEVIICEDMDVSLRIVSAGNQVFQIKERTTVYVSAPDSFTHGDPNKAEKELFYLRRIFKKNELRGKLPLLPRLRLKSMCYYHIAVKMQREQKVIDMYASIFKSFFLYPPGYNGKTNLPMLVMFLYGLPMLGPLLKRIRRVATAL